MTKQKRKFTRFEMEILNALWEHGRLPIRDIQEGYPEKTRPAYTTVQTIVYRLETKGAVKRVKKIGNAHIFEATVTPDEARGRFADELLNYFGGSIRPLMAYFIQKKKVSAEDLAYMKSALDAGGLSVTQEKTGVKKR